MYSYEEIKTDEKSIASSASVLSTVFGKADLFSTDFIRWQYADNPAGTIVGYNATQNNEVAAHYVTQPFHALLDGRKEKGVLSLNTATTEAHRGKGLFTILAQKTYELAASQGYSFVIGVANQNSVNGFVKKLGFQLVGQLQAMIGAGSLPRPEPKTKVAYQHHWDEQSLKWRLSNPYANYFSKVYGSFAAIYSPTAYPFVHANLGYFDTALLKNSGAEQKSPFPFKLWIGLDCRMNFKSKLFFDIPQKFRPSPLSLIYLDLTGKCPKLNKDELVFQALDFDAY